MLPLPCVLDCYSSCRRSARTSSWRASAEAGRLRVGVGAGVPQSLRRRWRSPPPRWRPRGSSSVRRSRGRSRRSPLLTAVTALDLDEMSGGRFSLGLGTGTRRMRTDWLGAPAERPARRVRETVEAIRAVWDARRGGRGRVRGRAGAARGAALRPCGAGARLRSRSSLRRSTRAWRAPRAQSPTA